MNDVHAVVFLADKQQSLDVLRLAAGLDDVWRRVRFHMCDRRVKIRKLLERDNRHAVFLEFLLTESAVVFESVGVRCSAHDELAGRAQRCRFLTLSENVIENDNVGPVDVFLPAVDLGNETIGDLALGLTGDVVADVVTVARHLPGDIADQRIERNKKKTARVIVHWHYSMEK